MREFVFKLDKVDVDALATVRRLDGLMAAQDENAIWLRGVYDVPEPDISIRQLPIKNTFLVDEYNNLFKPGGLTPVDVLKEMSWQVVHKFMQVELPVSAMPGKTSQQVNVKLIPSGNVKEGAALLTTLSIWKEYAETAPASRLAFLQFAVSERNEVLIVGNPLPPLPGKEYWKAKDILLPCGYEFEIPLVAEFISQQLNTAGDAVIVFDGYNTWQRIENINFVEARRSAIRLTRENRMVN